MDVDPREISKDPGLKFEQLTDDESPAEDDHQSLKDLEREEMEALRKIEEIRHRKIKLQQQSQGLNVERQVSRTPSPKKSQQLPKANGNELKPKNLSQRLQQAQSNIASETEPDLRSIAPTSTSYFLEQLQESEEKQRQKKVHQQELMKSRVYTFGVALEIEPKVVDEKEYYSGQQISRRYVGSTELAEFFEDKKVFRLPKLFAKITPPNFNEPQYPNWVVVGILSDKSPVRPTSDGGSKYVVFTLTDFKFSIQVTIFGKAVEKYNKLRLGDIIALLNPSIYVRLEGSTSFKTFSLSIAHGGDSILEIGRSKHYGHCPSIKKDGTICSKPINREFEECCSYHKELRIRRTAGKRMEFQTTARQVSPTRNGQKQEMFLGKADNQGNWTSSRVVTNENAPINDRISNLSKLFTSREKHAAFFNSDVVDVQAKAKKSNKKNDDIRRADDARLVDKLEKKRKFRAQQQMERERAAADDEIPKKKAMTLDEKRALLKYAYGSSGLAKLGFDPSSRGSSKGILSMRDENLKKQTSAIAAEFNELAKKRKVALSVAEEVLQMRREQKKATDEMLKRIEIRQAQNGKARSEPKAGKAPKIKAHNDYQSKNPSSIKEFVLSDSDSDSDLHDGIVGVRAADPSAFSKFLANRATAKHQED